MPEAPPAPAPETQLQAEISAKTTAAVQDTGFGKEFDAEFDAAVKSDSDAREAKASGLPASPAPTPAKPAAAPAKPAEKAKAEPKTEPSIPDVLLGKKKDKAEEPKGDDGTDPEREKFIKEQTAGLSPKAADRFRAIEAKAHAAEQRAKKTETLEKELTVAREQLSKASDNTEAKALKAQIEELDAVVQKNALADHPKFKAAFDNQIAEKVAIAKKQVAAEGAAEVEALLSLPETAQRNRRLNEILQELEPVEAGKFSRAIAEVDELSAKRTSELNNWKFNKTKLSELAAAEGEKQIATRQAQIDTALKTVLPKFTNDDNGIELFRKVDGNDEWNKSVESRLDNVKKIVGQDLSREDATELAAWAMSGAEYRKLFLTQRALVVRLQEELASLKGGQPDLGAGGADNTGPEEEGDAISAIARMAQRTGAVR